MTREDALRKTRELKLLCALHGEKETHMSLDYLHTVEKALQVQQTEYVEGEEDWE